MSRKNQKQVWVDLAFADKLDKIKAQRILQGDKVQINQLTREILNTDAFKQLERELTNKDKVKELKFGIRIDGMIK